ncbi:TIGR04283 family arsenosugar biosynthesis glycosyltransferase [Altibacter sp. HG106]|uniref:TIGR04283 family arsenosugar biosynthesis glycosyltransferase n=1 Tax=Altibacter sp. HG106 TaxID=3023937 RepID=UPI002350FBCE|nr:TIGR04283 family arsenosugar biosynthesis glycosyltransferase [Altibacter sp. HG106]MDC7994234.1 TIGR04283 family arsenosugar biosynthesis glycosyltransferase [Altibacter sp. HG106]
MISIIIPVYNEAQRIAPILRYLTTAGSSQHIREIIVVDGNSTDDTKALATSVVETSIIPIQVMSSEKGRARQMNTGAKVAEAEVLYFLHVDSYPPLHFDAHILKAVATGDQAGCFRMRFDSQHPWLQLAGWLTRFNWRACRGGDQSIFVTQSLFDTIGGFNEEYIIYEDIIFINQLYAHGSFTVLPYWLTTSARLYREKGIATLQYHFYMIYLKKALGATPEELYGYYCKHIKSQELDKTPMTVEAIFDK